ncbi:unannotated protein [freshwater metagenome]|uniref:Unannotated protein n=1 Tax=freshwater metagenome TaxID=449393 RepID=A0A6J7F9R6_9ZZZZ
MATLALNNNTDDTIDHLTIDHLTIDKERTCSK